MLESIHRFVKGTLINPVQISSVELGKGKTGFRIKINMAGDEDFSFEINTKEAVINLLSNFASNKDVETILTQLEAVK
jgi:hypothetical protein